MEEYCGEYFWDYLSFYLDNPRTGHATRYMISRAASYDEYRHSALCTKHALISRKMYNNIRKMLLSQSLAFDAAERKYSKEELIRSL